MKFGGVGIWGWAWEELKGGVWVNMMKIYHMRFMKFSNDLSSSL